MVYVLIATCFVIIVTGIIAPLFVYIETGNPAVGFGYDHINCVGNNRYAVGRFCLNERS